jgi:hypothetical protein
MHRFTPLFAALLLFIPGAAQSQVQPGQTFTARVTEATDGDTYDVRRSAGGEVTIRLHGVDAPETSQPYGKAATRAARRYVGGKTVRLEVVDIGRYGRAVARINVQGGDHGRASIPHRKFLTCDRPDAGAPRVDFPLPQALGREKSTAEGELPHTFFTFLNS